jgi:hypothetical protein
VATEAVRDFDRGMLRSQNRARRAREAVKTRLERSPGVDAAVLLEMARGNTPRDAEWALAQLARLAAEGQTVEGVAVEGPAGV